MSTKNFLQWKDKFSWHQFWIERLEKDYQNILDIYPDGDIYSGYIQKHGDLPMYCKASILEQRAHQKYMDEDYLKIGLYIDKAKKWIIDSCRKHNYFWMQHYVGEVNAKNLQFLYCHFRSIFNEKQSPFGFKNPYKYPVPSKCIYYEDDDEEKIPICTHKTYVGFKRISDLYEQRYYRWKKYTALWDESVEKYYLLRKIFDRDLANLIYKEYLKEFRYNKEFIQYIISQLYEEKELLYICFVKK